MTTRRTAIPDPMLSRGPGRPWPPTCTICGWTGTPTAHASPYIGCCGDRSRHQRTPATFTREQAVLWLNQNAQATP